MNNQSNIICRVEDAPYQNVMVLNLTLLVNRIPYELLKKIYNEYFRPIRFYQIYRELTTDSMYLDHMLYDFNKAHFGRHLPIFMFGNICEYIKKKDISFEMVLRAAKLRGYVSRFRKVHDKKSALFLELLMHKYH